MAKLDGIGGENEEDMAALSGLGATRDFAVGEDGVARVRISQAPPETSQKDLDALRLIEPPTGTSLTRGEG